MELYSINYSAGFDFDPIAVIAISFCIEVPLPNFIHSKMTTRGEVMMSYRFSRWREQRRSFTSGFRLGDVAACLKKVIVYQKTKFRRDRSIHGCDINKRPPYWNSTFGFDFTPITVFGISLRVGSPTFIQIELPRRSYDVISIFMMADTAAQFHFRFWIA